MGRERAFWAGPCEQLAGARGFGPALDRRFTPAGNAIHVAPMTWLNDDFLHESVRLTPRLINFFWGIGPYVTSTNRFEG